MLPKASLLETRRPRGGVGEARGLALAVGVGHKAVGLIPGQALGAALGVNDFHGAAPGVMAVARGAAQRVGGLHKVAVGIALLLPFVAQGFAKCGD